MSIYPLKESIRGKKVSPYHPTPKGRGLYGIKGKRLDAPEGIYQKRTGNRGQKELLDVFESYRQRLLPLIVPITLLKHHLNRNRVPDWVHEQTYLNPYPMELMLRNHV